ncbi:MAG: enoyl-CoA hydratase/isomerase family protein [Desulfobacter sp.]|nr:MAG: enoyl-CoA hydratase/isomerase family protein [Desulfobacter sp.]
MSIIYEKKDKIAYITLNRPEAHNALDSETLVQLIDAWKNYRDDDDLRCAIITGTGDHTFCAGADLANLIPLFTGTKTPETEAEKRVQADPLMVQKAWLRDLNIYKPVIAGINGHAIAGGLELLYGTDIRIAAEGSRFGLQEVKWGVFPAGGSSVKLPRQIPYARAMEMMLTGELIEGQEALDMGLINRLVPRDKVMEECERLAKIIVKNAPLAVTAIKKAVMTNVGLSIEEGLKNEFDLAVPVFLSQDAQEGSKAFKEKRSPVFKGI